MKIVSASFIFLRDRENGVISANYSVRSLREGAWLEGVVRGEFIKSFSGVDELWYWRRRLKVRYTLGFHDVLN